MLNNTTSELCLHGRDTPHISRVLYGNSTMSRLIDIIDGDTIVCVIPVLGEYFKFSIRLKGIDTCEMKSKDMSVKEKALRARDYLVQRVLNISQRLERKEIQRHLDEHVVVVHLRCYDFDKYGRLLADVYVNEANETDVEYLSISEELLREKLAYPYDGGKKTLPEEF